MYNERNVWQLKLYSCLLYSVGILKCRLFSTFCSENVWWKKLVVMNDTQLLTVDLLKCLYCYKNSAMKITNYGSLQMCASELVCDKCYYVLLLFNDASSAVSTERLHNARDWLLVWRCTSEEWRNAQTPGTERESFEADVAITFNKAQGDIKIHSFRDLGRMGRVVLFYGKS